MENDKTGKTEDAMDKLATTKGWYIAMAKFIAAQIVMLRDPWYTLARTGPTGAVLLRKEGTGHSYAVRMAMTRAGMLAGYTGTLHFIGAAFNSANFLEATGERFSYDHQKGDDEPGRSVHQRTVEIWQEKKGGQIQAVPEPKVPQRIADRLAAAAKEEADATAARTKALGGR